MKEPNVNNVQPDGSSEQDTVFNTDGDDDRSTEDKTKGKDGTPRQCTCSKVSSVTF